MKHLGTKTLETQRLLLRCFELNDAELMYKNWANDDNVTKYLTWPTHSGVNVSKNVLEQWIRNYSKDNYYQWAILLKNIHEPIGSISIVQQRDDIKMVHVGYCIGKNGGARG